MLYVTLLILIMFIEYTIVYPSLVTFTQHQAFHHDRSPVMKELAKVRESIELIKSELKEIRGEMR